MGLNKLEHQQLDDYVVYIDHGIFAGYRILKGFRLICVYTIFGVKQGRWQTQKSCCCSQTLTATPSESVYSGVVSLRGLHMCVLVGKLDGMVPWATDIGNAYLEAITSEKVCIRAGP